MLKGVKRVICIMLIASLAISLGLAGCKKADDGSTDTTTKATTTVKATTSAEKSDTTTEETIEELEPYKIKWYVLEPNGVQKDNAVVADAVSKYTEEKFNATVDMQFLDWTYNDKLKLIIASGEEFDLCFTASWWEYGTYVAKGAFLPLDELFPEYAPKTFETMSTAYKQGPMVDGKLYAIPTEQAMAMV